LYKTCKNTNIAESKKIEKVLAAARGNGVAAALV
jgi:hypothetical protein